MKMQIKAPKFLVIEIIQDYIMDFHPAIKFFTYLALFTILTGLAAVAILGDWGNAADIPLG